MSGRPVIVVDIHPELVAELFDDELLARLGHVGEVVGTTGNASPADRGHADILVTGWGTVPLPGHRGPRDPLRLVVHSAGTVRCLVPKSLLADGVRLSHAAAGMVRSVAELALYFTLAQLRSLHSVDRRMHGAQDWRAAAETGLGSTVAGSLIGVIGASRVGRDYIALVRALGAAVLVYDPYLPAADAARLGAEQTSLDDLLRRSRVVALHAPVTEETRGMIDAERLALMPDGGILVNTARAALLDGPALIRELRTGRLSAALDVFDTEPLPAGDALWKLPNVLLTPHLGAATGHSRRAQGTLVTEEIERFCRGDSLQHEITEETYDRLA